MNLERVPLAPLTPIQVQQLARQPRYTKNQNILNSQSTYQIESKCLMRNPKYRIQKKVVLELLNSIKSFSYPEFLLGVHVDLKEKQQIHICPTPSLLKCLNKHFGASEILEIYEKLYSQSKDIKIHKNNQEVDIIIQLLNVIINQKLDWLRIKEIFKEQPVQDLINLKKIELKDQKLQLIVNMIVFLNNQTQFKLTKLTNQTIFKQKQIISVKDHCQRYISQNIKFIGIYIFLEFCISQKIALPQILLSISFCSQQRKLFLEQDFTNYIPDLEQFKNLKQKIRFQNFNRILTVQQLIEFEIYLVNEFNIIFPLREQNEQLIEILEYYVEYMKSTTNKINNLMNGKQSIDNLVKLYQQIENSFHNEEQKQKLMNLLTFIINEECEEVKNVPKIKLKIRKL